LGYKGDAQSDWQGDSQGDAKGTKGDAKSTATDQAQGDAKGEQRSVEMGKGNIQKGNIQKGSMRGYTQGDAKGHTSGDAIGDAGDAKVDASSDSLDDERDTNGDRREEETSGGGIAKMGVARDGDAGGAEPLEAGGKTDSHDVVAKSGGAKSEDIGDDKRGDHGREEDAEVGRGKGPEAGSGKSDAEGSDRGAEGPVQEAVAKGRASEPASERGAGRAAAPADPSQLHGASEAPWKRGLKGAAVLVLSGFAIAFLVAAGSRRVQRPVGEGLGAPLIPLNAA